MRTVLIVAGPTGSGKSRLAGLLAEALAGTVVNADALQLYQGLPILSNQPSREDSARAPHVLYGVLPATQNANAADYAALARRALEEVWAQGRQPILCGGTGLYIEALMHGLPDIPPVPPEILATAQQQRAELGPAAFHARLTAADPASATLHTGDAQRVVRAYSVLLATGKPLSYWQRQSRPLLPGIRFQPILLLPERAGLYAACDSRFLQMMAQGALEEARALLSIPLAVTPAKALGLRELQAHLRGECSREDAIQQAQTRTRNYAKRQFTWFRGRLAQAAGAQILQDFPGADMRADMVRAIKAL